MIVFFDSQLRTCFSFVPNTEFILTGLFNELTIRLSVTINFAGSGFVSGAGLASSPYVRNEGT